MTHGGCRQKPGYEQEQVSQQQHLSVSLCEVRLVPGFRGQILGEVLEGFEIRTSFRVLTEGRVGMRDSIRKAVYDQGGQ